MSEQISAHDLRGEALASLASWRATLQTDPNDAGARQAVAELLLDLGQVNEARGAYEDLARLKPNNPKVWKKLAEVCDDLGDLPAATTALERAIALDPKDYKPYGRLAEIYYRVGRVEEAIALRQAGQALRGPREKVAKKQLPPAPSKFTAPVYAELKRIAATDLPIVAGPWTGEVGFELLYWIPFLRRVIEDYGIDPRRLRVLSRGGVSCWYEGLAPADRYFELYDVLSPKELTRIYRERHLATGSDKATLITRWDADIIAQAVGPGAVEMLHPSLLYQLLGEFWRGAAPFSLVGGNITYQKLSPPESPNLPALPDRFTAVKFYSRDSFPMTPDNARFVRAFVLRLAERGPVVLLDTGVEAYSHEDYAPPEHPNILSLKHLMAASDNLHLQSCVVARAESVVCTYGGFAYLPLLYGKPVTAFYSCQGHQLLKHAQPVYLLSEKMDAPISIMSVESGRLTL